MLKLYPTTENVQPPFYKIYDHKSGETVIATEMENSNTPILMDDFVWFEQIPTTEALLVDTWSVIETVLNKACSNELTPKILKNI